MPMPSARSSSSSTDPTYLQVDPTQGCYVFHGAAAALLLRREEVRDNLPESYLELWEGKGSSASWLEVPILETCFVCVRGPEKEDLLEGFKALLSGKLVEDLVGAARVLPHDELLRRFYWVAYMSEHPSRLVLDFFDWGMEDPRENIRLSVLNGYMIRCWPEWRKRVETAARSDASEKVRELARRLIERIPQGS
jgi:hypothetical protein